MAPMETASLLRTDTEELTAAVARAAAAARADGAEREGLPPSALHRRIVGALAMFAVLMAVAGTARVGLCLQGPRLQRSGTLAVERKYYDHAGAYWQAPGRGISSSEVWADCELSHMTKCGDFCCCDEGFYWKSPKTVYQATRAKLRQAKGYADEASSISQTAKAAEGAVPQTLKDLGKSLVMSMYAHGQQCVAKADVPVDVQLALEDGEKIAGSGSWTTCSTFTDNSHTCGSLCCCNGGFKWEAKSESCVRT